MTRRLITKLLILGAVITPLPEWSTKSQPMTRPRLQDRSRRRISSTHTALMCWALLQTGEKFQIHLNLVSYCRPFRRKKNPNQTKHRAQTERRSVFHLCGQIYSFHSPRFGALVIGVKENPCKSFLQLYWRVKVFRLRLQYFRSRLLRLCSHSKVGNLVL